MAKNRLQVLIHLKTLPGRVDKRIEMNAKKEFFITALLLILLSGTLELSADATPDTIQSSSRVDWSTETFILSIKYHPPKPEKPLPVLRAQAEAAINNNIPQMFVEAVSNLTINSQSTISDSIIDSPSMAAAFRELAYKGRIVSSRFSQDLSEFHNIYHYDLYPDIAQLYVRHTMSIQQTPELTYVASGPYSGIVIYVESPLEVFGAHIRRNIQPALFPRVFDENMSIIIDKKMVDPEITRTRGMLHYYDVSQLNKVHSRVGEVPLYVHATALFGVHPTDMVVSTRAARQIKASPHMLSLINKGRIAVVFESTLQE